MSNKQMETMTCPFDNESAKVLWDLQNVNFEVENLS